MRRLITLVAALAAGVLLLGGCGLQAYDLPLPGKVVSDSDGYHVSAVFKDIDNVVPRTLVMVHDVPVGQVDSVTRDGWDAKVTMTIKKNVQLPADVTAQVQQSSLLGENYIGLIPPDGSTVAKSGALADGAEIPLAQTGNNPQVEDVLGALSMLLSGGGVSQLKTISTELNKAMDGRQGQVRDLLHQLDTMTGTLDDQKNAIVDAMKQVDTLTSVLNREHRAIGDALDSFGPALHVLHQQHQQLMTMLTSLDQLGTVATRVINESGANITSSLRDLQPVLTKLDKAGDSLPRGLMMAASFPFPKQADTLAKGDYSNALFHMDFDLGKVVKGLWTGGATGLPQLLQLCATYSKDCTQVQPVVSALCQLTHEDFACSMVGKSNAKKQNGAKAGPGKKTSPGVLGTLTQQLLGGGSTTDGPQPSPAPSPGGLGGLLGLLGGVS